jgi:hypothetical protein
MNGGGHDGHPTLVLEIAEIGILLYCIATDRFEGEERERRTRGMRVPPGPAYAYKSRVTHNEYVRDRTAKQSCTKSCPHVLRSTRTTA